jgi:DNA-binding transcriptional LysR family regulator
MSKVDRWEERALALDGHGLKVFLAVLETGSVTAAADSLGVSQSAVSHSLEKLRGLLHDPLFVKSGRGIVATAHAAALAEPARRLLDDMNAFARGMRFVAQEAEIELTVAANDFQRDLLLPAFRARIASKVRRFLLHVIPSLAPSADLLRERHCELIITPRPPEGSDILQKRLLVDHIACFYDVEARAAPRTLADYTAAPHVTVVYEGGRKTRFDQEIESQGVTRKLGATVPNFSGVPAFLRGTDMLASLPSLMRLGIMRGFGVAPLPCKISAMPMYLVWHRRHDEDPGHRFVRAELEETARTVMREIPKQEGVAGGA